MCGDAPNVGGLVSAHDSDLVFLSEVVEGLEGECWTVVLVGDVGEEYGVERGWRETSDEIGSLDIGEVSASGDDAMFEVLGVVAVA